MGIRAVHIAGVVGKVTVLRPIDHLYRGRDRTPDAIAVAGPGDPLSYRALVESVDALASALQARDPAPASRVGICARNTVEHLIAMLATYAAGKVWVPLNPTNSRPDLDRMIAATRPTLMITDAGCLDRFSPTEAQVIVAKPDGAPTELPKLRGLIEQWRDRRPTPVSSN